MSPKLRAAVIATAVFLLMFVALFCVIAMLCAFLIKGGVHDSWWWPIPTFIALIGATMGARSVYRDFASK
jgi:hypothetical protein